MLATDFLIAGAVSVVAGLDRTAVLQLMISRPIVAAPLTGLVLGHPVTGLQVGAMVELLWLGRLPVGAAIPPDDTQVAVGATALSVIMGGLYGLSGLGFSILCTLITMPLGKVGQHFDRMARNSNGRLLAEAETALEQGLLGVAESSHLRGVLHFALASLGTYLVISGAGSLALHFLAPLAIIPISQSVNWLWLVFPLVGTAVILGTINVSRSMTLFGASFTSAFLMLWLL